MKIQGIPAFSNRASNPYNAFLYEALEQRGCVVSEGWNLSELPKTHIVHIHWPEGCVNQRNATLATLGLAWMLLRVTIARMFRCKIVWTAHNVGTHDKKWPLIEKLFYRLFPSLVDGCIYLNDYSYEQMAALAPVLRRTPRAVIPHGHYRRGNFKLCSKALARRSLGFGSDQRLYVFFGQIRQYKNVPSLIRSFQGLTDENARLVIAGNPGNDHALRSEISRLAESDLRIKLVLRFLQDEELAEIIAASDLIVLPYSEISNSGSVILALSHVRPTLVPKTPAFTALARAVGVEWISLFEGELTSLILECAMNTTHALSDSAPDLSTLDWNRISNATLHFYRECSAGGK